MAPKEQRKKTAEIMFENFSFPGLNLSTQAILSLHGSGKTTGVVLDSGEGKTHAVTVYDGYVLPHTFVRIDVAGRDLTEYLSKIIIERGYSFTTPAEREIVRDIKEQLAYVTLDFDAGMDHGVEIEEKEYELPDGRSITLGKELFRCAEVLFKPSLVGKETDSIASATYTRQSCIQTPTFGKICFQISF